MNRSNNCKTVNGGIERQNWIDSTKIIGLYLMVLGHAMSDYDSIFSKYIYSFHIPMFFILSGYLHNNNNKDVPLKKYFLTLLVPYLLLNIIGIVLSIPRLSRPDADFNFELVNISSFLYGNPQGHTSPSWFVFCLFWGKLLFDLMKKYNFTTIGFIIIIGVIITNDFYKYIKIPIVINRIVVSIPFIYFGFLLKKTNILLYLNKLYYLVLFLLLSFSSIILNGSVTMYSCTMGNSVILYYLYGIIGSVSIMILAKLLFNNYNKIITVLAAGSLLIVFYHTLFISLCEILEKTLNLKIGNLTWVIICVLIIIVFYYPIIFTQSKFPFLLGNRLKNVLK